MNLTRLSKPTNSSDPFQGLLNLTHPYFGLSMLSDLDKGVKSWYPAIDIKENKENIVVKADMPGLKKEEITISVEDTLLTLKGERKTETEEKDKGYYRSERFYGAFERTIDIGVPIDQTKIKAQYKEGVLEITLPKSEKVKAKQITVE